jgi:molecular chaperone GrpE
MADKPMTEPAEGEPAQTSSETPDAVAELQRERDELYDRLLRKSAEFDNYRKRIERERREQADQTVTR